MKCVVCGFEAPVTKFRYMYNPRIDESLSMRQCPKCFEMIGVDELKGVATQAIKPGDPVWQKSAGVTN